MLKNTSNIDSEKAFCGKIYNILNVIYIFFGKKLDFSENSVKSLKFWLK